MDIMNKNESPPVKRITVDEFLDSGLVRLLICDLKKEIEIFLDNESDWEKEEELIVDKDNYIEKIDLIGLTGRKLKWEKLEEGKVFLAGQFGKQKGNLLRRKPTRTKVILFDRKIKNEIKTLYFNALGSGADNA